MRKVIIGLAVLVVVLVVLGLFFWRVVPNLEPKITVEEISSGQGSSLYFKRKERGLNYKVAVISSSPATEFEPDSSSEYVYSAGDTRLYHKLENDTLTVYTYHLADEPEKFQSGFTVVQKEIESAKYDETRQRLKKAGFEEF